MPKTLDKLIKTILAGAALVSFSLAGQGCITGEYGCEPDPSDPYNEICKKRDCVEYGERQVEKNCDNCKIDENGMFYEMNNDIWCKCNGELVNLPKTETETYCMRYEEFPVTRTRSTPHTFTSKEKRCISYDSSHNCIGYKTIDVIHHNQ